MNRATAEDLRNRENAMYELRYPYGAWVVRKDRLGLFPTCSLKYFRDEPTEAGLRAIFGERFMHFSPATPDAATGGQTG